ncbi:phage tail sheath subtilisin-like domain-containing protein [Maridesulfovibrio hydrothermalis]|uniref:Major tail sheath protein n=1 Tax=Maridesulfovibrio hydrothermalis AM13 = DSM 14728 TaxID=1121451 RepID=L0R7M9_9BACT|nr:phage tail sheath subtilisin-like domain-containing protein [Maridesulfovibrio hydrothermalis]CCO22227.1 Major tail sheath protein [Maridesulfovibrio hydrothermalis AM13 = DSM 14728]
MGTDFLHGCETVEINNGTRPIKVVKSSVIGLIGTAPDADNDVFPMNEPVLIPGNQLKAAKLGQTGTLKDAVDGIFDQTGAMVVVVRVEEGADTTATMSNIVGDGTAQTGVHAFLGAQSHVHVTPKLLIAPGFTSQRVANAANPVVAELLGIAERLRAVIIADGPNDTNAEAIAYREDWGSARIYVCDPAVMVWDTTLNKPVSKPVSSRVAGLISKMDNKVGYWASPSNNIINGVVGLARAVDFNLSDPNCAANYLNENEVATVIHHEGYRLWGNRTCATDPLWAFLSVRRAHDMVYESIEQAFLWAMDKPFSAQLILDIQGSVNAFLRHQKALGAILGGKCWLDPELNTKETLMAGQLYLDFDNEAPAPLERLTFRAHRNNGYYTELVNQVLTA